MRKIMAALLLALPFCISSADEIRIYNWEEYLADAVIEAFKEETGHTIKHFYFDNEDLRNTTITSGRGKGYDLILMDSLGLELLASQGIFQDLSKIKATLSDRIDPRWSEACGDYGIPYAWGTMGIFYRSSVAVEPLHSWRQLFVPPQEHHGRIVMYMDSIDSIAAALMATGASPFSDDTDELRKAFDLLKQQSSALLSRDYHYSYANAHGSSSRMSMSLGYSGEERVLEETSGQNDWEYLVPEEGTLLWVECFAVPDGRTIKEATLLFLDFINRPDVAAINAETLWFSTTNQAAIPFTSQEYQEDSTLFPDKDILARSMTYKRVSADSLRLRERMKNALD
jgi:spermidine/putrescine-binding protein